MTVLLAQTTVASKQLCFFLRQPENELTVCLCVSGAGPGPEAHAARVPHTPAGSGEATIEPRLRGWCCHWVCQ